MSLDVIGRVAIPRLGEPLRQDTELPDVEILAGRCNCLDLAAEDRNRIVVLLQSCEATTCGVAIEVLGPPRARSLLYAKPL